LIVTTKPVRKRPFAKASEPKAFPEPVDHAAAVGTSNMLLGYARVSKGDEQNNALQARALKAAGCRKLFEEVASGGRWDRPQMHRMLDQLREGDTVVVWKLDRLSRSLKDVLHIMERIAAAGAGFRSVTESIDTTTPAGRMMMQMVGSFAEFERAMIRERTSAGLAAARAEGRVGGARSRKACSQAVSRRRDGPALQCQPAHRVTHRGVAQGAGIVALTLA
jgi:DNA invertase Pin-like site-specific DNA recombinase